MAVPTYIPINSVQRIPLIPSPLLISCLLDNSHLRTFVVIPNCGFNLHFYDPDIEYLFIYLLDICIFFFFLEKFLFRFLAHLKTQVIVGYWVLYEFFVYLSITLTRFIVCKYLLPFHTLSLHFVGCLLC